MNRLMWMDVSMCIHENTDIHIEILVELPVGINVDIDINTFACTHYAYVSLTLYVFKICALAISYFFVRCALAIVKYDSFH